MKRQKKQPQPEVVSGYDYSDREARERTAYALFQRAKNARTAVEIEWERYNDYYNGIHDVTRDLTEFCRENDVPWLPASVPDPYILVESQIEPSVPQPEFRGRDDDLDSTMAKRREFAVRYIAENNRLSDMNTRNERRLLKLGDAFWKAYWDEDMRCGEARGDIRVSDIPVEAVFPDPAVRGGSVQDGQYLDYVYRIHKVRFAQVFRAELEALGITAEETLGEDYVSRSEIFDMTSALCDTDDTVQVLEHWFRQPVETTENGETVPAGAVACSIQAGGHELRYIPNYWRRTGAQNTLFPFVHYWRIQDENRFWNRSELAAVLDLVDAADRKLAAALLNDSFLSNDILLVEEGALADGEELTNEPGAIVHLKQGRMGGVQRLGGLQSVGKAAMDITWFKEQIERASRSYDTGTGKETARVTTAAGLSMLRADGREQSDIKRADRNAGFERLYELLDWLSLEFFDDDRMLYLGAPEGTGAPGRCMIYNSADFARTLPEVRSLTGEVLCPSREFFPRVDITVQAAEGARRDRQTTLQALDSLTRANITAENWRIFAAELEILDIPDRQEIVGEWERRFAETAEKASPPPSPAAAPFTEGSPGSGEEGTLE